MNIINSAISPASGASSLLALTLPNAKFVAPTFSLAVKFPSFCPLHHTCDPSAPNWGDHVAVITIYLFSTVGSAFVGNVKIVILSPPLCDVDSFFALLTIKFILSFIEIR